MTCASKNEEKRHGNDYIVIRERGRKTTRGTRKGRKFWVGFEITRRNSSKRD